MLLKGAKMSPRSALFRALVGARAAPSACKATAGRPSLPLPALTPSASRGRRQQEGGEATKCRRKETRRCGVPATCSSLGSLSEVKSP